MILIFRFVYFELWFELITRDAYAVGDYLMGIS